MPENGDASPNGALRAIWAQPATKATIFLNLDSYSLVWIDRIVRLEMYKS